MAERPRQEADWDTTSVTEAVQIPLATRRDRAHLIVLAGENLGQMFRVDQSETIIGRAPDGHIRVQDGSVSRRHSRIIQVGGEVWIEDLGSSNGTYVNEGRIVRQLLRDGDKIQMGSTTILKFTYADELGGVPSFRAIGERRRAVRVRGSCARSSRSGWRWLGSA
jgi:pSer/pThr/pTyr-binding forkhead associated (FHA) protein